MIRLRCISYTIVRCGVEAVIPQVVRVSPLEQKAHLYNRANKEYRYRDLFGGHGSRWGQRSTGAIYYLQLSNVSVQLPALGGILLRVEILCGGCVV